MGIKHFFQWYRKKFPATIHTIKNAEKVPQGTSINNLMIDMNGIFHSSAQKAYEYGNYKPNRSLMGHRQEQRITGADRQLNMFKDVCATVDKVISTVNPTSRVILCVDGPAPIAKQCQQRKRRFLSALEKAKDTRRSFDSNCITPGTKFMDFLSKYIDWYIRKKLSDPTKPWGDIEVIFSNEKCPGEGEHKLIHYIRKYGNRNESFCIHGMDADLIMLSLGTHFPKFYILREDQMSSEIDYYLLDIGGVRGLLADEMRWKGDFDETMAINDFIFMCFTVGNDFLPHIPGIEIIEGGIDFMLDVYKNVCEAYGHLTRNTETGLRFRKKSLSSFLGTIAQYEEQVFTEKQRKKGNTFPDELLDSCSTYKDGTWIVDIKKYRKGYYETNIIETGDKEKICHDYLEGMQWVLTYYTQGVPNWDWYYPYHYAPFSTTLAKHVGSYKFPTYTTTTPIAPFIQLLCVLPPKSAQLLPPPLDKVLTNGMQAYCPEEFKIDLSGKRQAWEGTAILPMVDYTKICPLYFEALKKVEDRERKRNILGKSFVYKKTGTSYEFSSYYGNINCRVTLIPIEM